MRALTVEELGFVSGGWNPFVNPSDPSTWRDSDEKPPQQRFFEMTVKLDAQNAAREAQAADRAAAVIGPAAGALVGAALSSSGAGAPWSIGGGEIAGAGASAFVAAAGRFIPAQTRQFYLFLYYSILARYGM
jgi:hypothetical protein